MHMVYTAFTHVISPTPQNFRIQPIFENFVSYIKKRVNFYFFSKSVYSEELYKITCLENPRSILSTALNGVSLAVFPSHKHPLYARDFVSCENQQAMKQTQQSRTYGCIIINFSHQWKGRKRCSVQWREKNNSYMANFKIQVINFTEKKME